MEPSSLQDAIGFTGRAHLAAARDLATVDSGRVRFGPGPVAVDVTLGFAKRDEEEEVDVLGCQLRLCAADGAWWQGSGEFSPSFLSPFEIEPEPQARFAAGAPASWTSALAERPLLSGVHDLWDDREHVELDLGERRIGVPLKYQGPVLDLGLLADEDEGDRLVVRISRLHDEEVDEIDPFVYTLPLARLLDIDTALDDEGWLDEAELVLSRV